tara:strand:- start:377 stop:1033 length:657 start_codon:yes stop_codon:yes gene_type:complete
MFNKLFSIIVIFVFYSFLNAQSVIIYPKKGKKIKLNKTFHIKNGSVVIKDSLLIKKIIPIKSIAKLKYAQKSYKPIGNIFLNSGKLILNGSLITAVIGNPTLFYQYGGIGSILISTGLVLNNIGARFGRNIINYKFKGLNYINRELIFRSVLADMGRIGEGEVNGEYHHEPHGKKLSLPKSPWFLNLSAKNEPRGIEAWIEKHRLREKRFLQIAIPKK